MTTKTILGDAPRLYQPVFAHVKDALWNDIRNAKTCAWMVTALILSGQATPSAWLPYFPSGRFAQSIQRQIVRWLENEHIDPTLMYGPAVVKALRHWGPHLLKLALDTSLLFNTYCLIRICILFRGRAVPLVTRVIKHASAQVSTELLKPILAEARGIVAAAGLWKGFCQVKLLR